MIGMRVRDFYKRKNYENVWYFLLGMLICTFIFIPMGLALKLFDKLTGN